MTTEPKPPGDAAESIRRLQGIVGSAMDAIITINDAQLIMLFNPAAERMFGVLAADAIGAPIERFIPERFRAGHSEHIRRFKEAGVTNRRMGALGAISGVRANGQEFPLEASISKVEIGDLRIATVILRDITEREANEEARLLLAREVDHRAKNALAVVQAVVSLTRAPTKEAFVAAVRGRISALGRAHSLLAQNRWQGGDLTQIIADETAPYLRPGQIEISAPAIVVGPDAVQPLSLLIHELATNAVKHGALSADQGRVHVAVRILPDQRLELSWTESGGPAVEAPTAMGFGSTLVTEVVRRQLGGEIVLDWLAEGLSLIAILPVATFRRSPAPGAGPAGGVPPETPEPIGRLRVLVAEDEMLIAMELSAALGALGWEVVGPAATIDEAIGLIESTPDLDVAVLDVNLGGQLAYPIAERLRELGVPFVFCTGYEQVDPNARYNDCPIVRKPVDIRHLTDELLRVRQAA